MTTTKNILFWTITIWALAFFGTLTYGLYDEWWTDKTKKEIGNYPWRPINENPWYYDNPDIYSTAMLTERLLFTIALTVLAGQLYKKDKTKILYALMTCFGLFVLIYINVQLR
jgi:hypothetical protein